MRHQNKKMPRLEEDGLYAIDADHFEMFETTITIIFRNHKGVRSTSSLDGYVRVPSDVIRHLKLKNRDRVTFAIKKK